MSSVSKVAVPPTPLSNNVPTLSKEDLERNLSNMATTLLFGITTTTATQIGLIRNTYESAEASLNTTRTHGGKALRDKLQEVLTSRFEHLTGNRYKDPKLLGKGTDGSVFLATRDTKSYAVKILRPVDEKQIPREIEMHRSLKGHNIRHLVPCADSFILENDLLPKGWLPKTQKVHVLATEFFGKKTLHQSIQTDTWNLKMIQKFSLSMLEFLEAFHKENVHSDISPDNIIITKDTHILDLGSSFKLNAKIASRNAQCFYIAKRPYRSSFGLVLGNNSEEAVAFRKNIDYFSFGIILLEILLKENPLSSLDHLFDKVNNPKDPFTIQLIRLHALSEITPLSQTFIKMIPQKTRDRFFTRKSTREHFTLKPFPFAPKTTEAERKEVDSLLQNFKADLEKNLAEQCKRFPKDQVQHLKDFIFSHLLAEKILDPQELQKHPFLTSNSKK